MTAFASVRVPLWDDLAFHLDGNTKITRDDGAPESPVANAFSLPQIATCPGSTATCREPCYVHGLQANQPEIHRTYVENERAIHAVLSAPTYALWARTALAEHLNRTAVHSFRWHVSGDVFSRDYAEWIVSVCRVTPWVSHWIYTRSHHEVPVLLQAPNMVVNISADRDNWQSALTCHAGTGARVCYFARDGEVPPPSLPPGSVIFPDYPNRGRGGKHPSLWWAQLSRAQRRMVCPADYFGQSAHVRCGPCRKCLT